MTVNVEDLPQYAGKRVLLTVKRGDAEPEQLEGKAEAANSAGVLLKPKGRTSLDLFELNEIEGIELAPEKESSLKAKTLKVVELGAGKSHLLERHGYTLTEVNGLTEESAVELHGQIDHPKEDLGHVHGAKASEERAAALEEKAAAEQPAEVSA